MTTEVIANAASVAADHAASTAAAANAVAGTQTDPNAALPTTIGEPAAPAPAPTGPTAPEGKVVAYDKTGDVGLDMSLEFIGKLGFGPDNVGVQTASKGDFSILKAQLAQLGDKAKGYESFIALAEKSYKDGAERDAARQTKDRELIAKAAGGADQWKAIASWASQAADPAEKVEINEALAKGGKAAIAMVKYLEGLYAKASGPQNKEPASVLTPGAAAAPATASHGPLTAREYSDEVQKLSAKKNGNIEGTREYDALKARRAAGRR